MMFTDRGGVYKKGVEGNNENPPNFAKAISGGQALSPPKEKANIENTGAVKKQMKD